MAATKVKQELKQTLERFPGKRIWIIGDLMLDEYIWGHVGRISPEAPVPIVEANRQTHVLGGASNVAHNICALGGEVFLAGVIGPDLAANSFRDALKESGIDDSHLVIDPLRPTTQKTRVVAMHQQILRLDRESKEPISPDTENSLLDDLESHIHSMDAIILSDYAKGVITETLAQRTIALARRYDKIIAVDPKGHDYRKYRGATVLTPNKKEVETVLNVPQLIGETAILEAGTRLLGELNLRALLMTRGEHGMSLFQEDANPFSVPAITSDVFDVTGAGDTALSALVLALAAGGTWRTAVELSNYAAAVVVKKLGTATSSREEIASMF